MSIVDRLLEEARLNEAVALASLLAPAEDPYMRGLRRGYHDANRQAARRLRRLALECTDPDPAYRPAGVS